jgi:RNA polymerase subunit RPABC4/transcription elongation factor Spt4
LFVSPDVWYNAGNLLLEEPGLNADTDPLLEDLVLGADTWSAAEGDWMNWNNVSLIVLGLAAFFGAFVVALWVSLVIWAFRDMRARTRDAFAQLLAALMVFVLGPLGIILYFMLRPRETLAEKYERSLEEEALLQDIEERQICPGCKQPIESDYVLCPICHTRLRHPCVHCGRLIHPRWTVCPYCAQSQRPVPGVERAGRVTLLDLESEGDLSSSTQVLAAAGVSAANQLPPDLAAELQREAQSSVGEGSELTYAPEEALYGIPADVDLQQDTDQIPTGETPEADEQDHPPPQDDEISSEAPDDGADPEIEGPVQESKPPTSETGQAQDETAKGGATRPLSLFRRQ